MSSAKKGSALLPDAKSLRVGLASLFRGNGDAQGQPLTILRRSPFISESTFASEVVTCLRGEGDKMKVLCKYTTKLWGDPGEESWGHRRGVLHEAAVYRDILQPVGMAPHFYGAYTDTARRETWLVLEFLDGSVRVNHSTDPDAMRLAARWIGRFHAVAEVLLHSRSFPFLKTFDPDYYRGWVDRTLQFAGPWHERFPWLKSLAHCFEGWAPLLLARRTVIHGEYYARNVLFLDKAVYPVDWESAAIAAGEIDLAALIEMWPAETVRQCERDYREARWPDCGPADFKRTVDAARIFNMFRWLGDELEWTSEESSAFYFQELQAAAERLGLI